MLQHLFYVMIGFDSKFKGIQKPFENGIGKSISKKKRKFSFVSLSLPHFRHVGPFPPLARLFSRTPCWASSVRAGNSYNLMQQYI
jgi:hypothetical protein